MSKTDKYANIRSVSRDGCKTVRDGYVYIIHHPARPGAILFHRSQRTKASDLSNSDTMGLSNDFGDWFCSGRHGIQREVYREPFGRDILRGLIDACKAKLVNIIGAPRLLAFPDGREFFFNWRDDEVVPYEVVPIIAEHAGISLEKLEAASGIAEYRARVERANAAMEEESLRLTREEELRVATAKAEAAKQQAAVLADRALLLQRQAGDAVAAAEAAAGRLKGVA